MITLTVLGMECGHCVQSVTAAVQAVPGARTAAVDLATGVLRVEGGAEEAAVREAIRRAGYDTAP